MSRRLPALKRGLAAIFADTRPLIEPKALPGAAADARLMERLRAFALGRGNSELFEPDDVAELVRRGWAFEHTQRGRPCVILTDKGWAASGVPG
mgnify:CR=1 FL=1